MSNILTISKREVTRLRTRFTGKSRIIVAAVLALAMLLSYVIYHQDLALSKGLYNIGVSPDGPSITDARFNILEIDPQTGYRLLYEKGIDVYVEHDRVSYNDSQRSEYALGALKQYLDNEELLRISQEYEIDQAFPLRIEVRHLKRLKELQASKQDETQASLSEIVGLAEASPEAPSEASSVSEPDPTDVPAPEETIVPEPEPFTSPSLEPVPAPDTADSVPPTFGETSSRAVAAPPAKPNTRTSGRTRNSRFIKTPVKIQSK